MAKSSFTILGLSAALLIITGCGKGFEAVKSTNSGGGTPVIQPRVTDAERQKVEQEVAVREQELQNQVAESNRDTQDPAKRLRFIPLNALADQMISAVSLKRIGGIMKLSMVVKSDIREQAADLNLTADLPIQQDGRWTFSEDGQIQIHRLSMQPVAVVPEQYRVFYMCLDNCKQVTVRVQRVMSEKEVAGDLKLEGYAASFTFQFADENDGENRELTGRLVHSTLNKELAQATDELITDLAVKNGVKKAEDTPVGETAPKTAGEAAPAGESQSQGETLEEIVVTARKIQPPAMPEPQFSEIDLTATLANLPAPQIQFEEDQRSDEVIETVTVTGTRIKETNN